jgi:deoxycytidylate deaminase
MSKRYHIVAKCYDRKRNLLSVGYNNYEKTHPLQAHFAHLAHEPHKIYLHAEIDAILKAQGKKIHIIVVERYNRHGQPRKAKPCKICSLAIKAFGIREVKHT